MIKDGDKFFCCLGCQSVWHILHSNGLEEFYSKLGRQTLNAAKISSGKTTLKGDDFYKQYITYKDGINQVSLIIEGIHCSACIWLIEKALIAQQGVTEVALNSSNNKLHLSYDPNSTNLDFLIECINNIGYNATPFDANTYEKSQQKKRRELYSKLLVGLFASMNIMWIAIAKYSGYFTGISQNMVNLLNFAEFILATPVLFYTGSGFFAGLKVAIKTRHANMDSLVASGASLTYAYSVYAMLTKSAAVYFDSVSMIITFVFIGKFLEATSKKSATDAVDTLMARMPSEVSIIKDGKEISILPQNIQIGDILALKAGQMALVDGICQSQRANLDMSCITGESMPVVVNRLEKITSGAIAIDSTIIYKASTTSTTSTLGRMLALLKSSLSQKPKIQELANQLASKFSITILSIASVCFIYYLLNSTLPNALKIAVSIIVIACPCALSLATPIATVVATKIALARGILFRYTSIIENLAKCDTIVFDKTGTITKANLKVKETNYIKNFDKRVLKALAKSSKHPISKAIASHLNQQEDIMLKDAKEIAGMGVIAKTADDKIVVGGSARLAKKMGVEIKNDDGGYYFAIDNELLAHISVKDEIRQEAKQSIQSLKNLGLNIHMLSGDNKKEVKEIAQILEISNYKAACLPEDKAQIISELSQKHKVLMVGDGINDTLALSKAYVAVAMGSGTDVSLSSSDVVLLGDDLRALVFAIKLAKSCMKSVKANIAFSLTYNAISVPLAAMGYVIPLVAAASMSLSSLVVVLNSLRLQLNKGYKNG